MSNWIKTGSHTPPPHVVVLLHVGALEEHGLVSGWYDPDSGDYVCLDDAISFHVGDVTHWRHLLDLPQ